MSSDFTSALTSPKVKRSPRASSPSIVNIDCDQKILPRDRSQSHKPQRPRLSAVSIRPRTASLMRSPSRARVDCQWNAKPRISTTKPVVAESVTDRAASDRQRAVAVRQGDVGHTGLLPRRGQRQRRADDVENAGAIVKLGVDGDAGENALVGAGDDDVPAGGDRPRW